MRNLHLRLACIGIALLAVPAIASSQSSLTIQTTALPLARAADSYHATILATGGVKPYTFTATNLPAGLSLAAATGVLSGIPKEGAVGNHQVTIKVTDSSKPTALAAQTTLKLGVNDAESVEICGGLGLGVRASFNGFVPFEASDAW